ncbi:MAG: hypothetical protein LBV31_00055 [Prevotellaceae bacterium]|jgi:ligand-binding sensor domain-containing protein|nr:hypothetical protein [Prevotellaceae bacterium]
MHKKHTLLFLICGMSFAWLFAGNDSFQMSLDNFPNLKQIPSNSVRRVFQDSEGYMWFGTLDGVCRYDGYNLKLFRSDFNTPNLLVHNEIFAISEDLQGRMWIGTKAGLNILDKRTMEITQYPDSMLYNEYVIALTCDAKGNMWIGTRNGLFRHDRKTNSLISYQNKLPVISVNSIYQDLDGKIWVMFWANGLYQYLPDTDSFVAFPRVGEHNNPFRLLQDKDKNYWLGTWSDGLFAFNPAEKKYTIPTFVGNGAGSCFFSIVQDDVYGYIWAMSMSGLHVLAPVGKDKRTTTVRSVDISDYHFPTTTLSEIIKDRNNCLWVGTFSEKAFVINLNKPEVKTYLLESLTKRINQPFRIIDI